LVEPPQLAQRAALTPALPTAQALPPIARAPVFARNAIARNRRRRQPPQVRVGLLAQVGAALARASNG
jgi:hypothetical protein